MPTDILVSVAERRIREKRDAADLIAIVFLIPMIACLLSCALSFECRAFEYALVEMGTE
jgi:hypothetical protein